MLSLKHSKMENHLDKHAPTWSFTSICIKCAFFSIHAEKRTPKYLKQNRKKQQMHFSLKASLYHILVKYLLDPIEKWMESIEE